MGFLPNNCVATRPLRCTDDGVQQVVHMGCRCCCALPHRAGSIAAATCSAVSLYMQPGNCTCNLVTAQLCAHSIKSITTVLPRGCTSTVNAPPRCQAGMVSSRSCLNLHLQHQLVSLGTVTCSCVCFSTCTVYVLLCMTLVVISTAGDVFQYMDACHTICHTGVHCL